MLHIIVKFYDDTGAMVHEDNIYPVDPLTLEKTIALVQRPMGAIRMLVDIAFPHNRW